MLKRFIYSEFFILFIFCVLFYSAMHYFSNSAMEGVKTIIVIRNVMLLRMIFSFMFAIFLGYIGVKMTGQVWPSALVHAVVVACILIMDLSLQEILADWMLALLIIGVTASITAFGGGLTLGYYWIRARR